MVYPMINSYLQKIKHRFEGRGNGEGKKRTRMFAKQQEKTKSKL